MKKLLLLSIPFLVIVLLVLLFLVQQKLIPLRSPSVPVPSNIPGTKPTASGLNSLSKSASRFQGIIEKIENQTLTVKGILVLDQPVAAAGAAAQNNPTITLQVLITPATEINGPPANGSLTESNKLSLADLKTGQLVIVSSPTDLSSLKTAEFTAKSVILFPSPLTGIQGKITNITGNTFIIETETTPSKQYRVITTKDTPVITTDIKKLTVLILADLKVGSSVMVSTADDLNSQTQIQASSIQLLPL